MVITTNQRFGRLKTIEPSGSRNGRIVWRCKCDCGNEHEASSKHLASGGTQSCGCMASEMASNRAKSRAIPFESRLSKALNGCMEWNGSRDKSGYGTLRVNKVDRKAHRLAYEKANGPIPKGMQVCHKCDNPPCCNPEHLFLGTALDNSKDCVSKNRQAFGQKNANAKLTEHVVVQIRKLYREGFSQQKISDLLGVHQTTVSSVIRQKSWGHVP